MLVCLPCTLGGASKKNCDLVNEKAWIDMCDWWLLFWLEKLLMWLACVLILYEFFYFMAYRKACPHSKLGFATVNIAESIDNIVYALCMCLSPPLKLSVFISDMQSQIVTSNWLSGELCTYDCVCRSWAQYCKCDGFVHQFTWSSLSFSIFKQ